MIFPTGLPSPGELPGKLVHFFLRVQRGTTAQRVGTRGEGEPGIVSVAHPLGWIPDFLAALVQSSHPGL